MPHRDSGIPITSTTLFFNQYIQLQREFQRLAHFMKYCQALRERQLPVQTAVLGRLGVQSSDILMQQGFAGMLKPSFVLVVDHKERCIVLAIRGTHSVKVSA